MADSPFCQFCCHLCVSELASLQIGQEKWLIPPFFSTLLPFVCNLRSHVNPAGVLRMLLMRSLPAKLSQIIPSSVRGEHLIFVTGVTWHVITLRESHNFTIFVTRWIHGWQLDTSCGWYDIGHFSCHTALRRSAWLNFKWVALVSYSLLCSTLASLV